MPLTADEIEAAIRTAALRAAGLHDASFPALTIVFQRTLRIPDDGRTYRLPADLGAFPLRSVDDFPATAPASWLQRGGGRHAHGSERGTLDQLSRRGIRAR